MRICLGILVFWLCASFARAGRPFSKVFTAHDGTTHAIAVTDGYLAHLDALGDTISLWSLPYPVYRLEIGDLNADGIPEIAVGVTKATRYSPSADKRLFIFKLYRQRLIRPLWMGSHVAATLIDFRIDDSLSPARIITVEHDSNGRKLSGQYHLGGFGLINDKIEPK